MNTAVVRALVALGSVALVVAGLSKASARRRQVQRAFLAFHDRIKHEQFGERELLRERRQTLTTRLEEALPVEVPFRTFAHGSYALQLGVKPPQGEFDIDVGLIFECGKDVFDGPVHAKRLVRDALVQGSRQVAIRRSCVTVYYAGGGRRPDYHVDMAVYVNGPDGKLYLAKGKDRSAPDKCIWVESQPEQLRDLIAEKFSGAGLSQFRRCVRYLKRWKHVNFRTSAPYSIALTMAAYQWLAPNAGGLVLDDPDDLDALLALTRRMRAAFKNGRLQIELPVPPGNDLLERMTHSQMRVFQEKLTELVDALTCARESDETETALLALRKQLGSDFEPAAS